MGNAPAICDRHLGEKQFAPIGSGNLAIQLRRTASSFTFVSISANETPAKIDSFSLKTAIRKCFLSRENKVDSIFLGKLSSSETFLPE